MTSPTPPVHLLASALSDNAVLVGLTVAGALPVLLVGRWLTRKGGARASRQVLIVALAPLVATWVGAMVAARAMFIDAHDLGALTVIAASAAVVGVLAAWGMASRLRVDTDALEHMAREIARGRVPDEVPDTSVRELRHLAQQLSSMSSDLADAHSRELSLERSRRELVGWVSHDLRSPLAGIRAMAEALEDGVVDDPADAQRYLRSIGAEVDRVAHLVDDLFELSRISSGTLDLQLHPTPVEELVGRVVGVVEPAARSRDVQVVCDLGPAPPLLVSPAEAIRVLRNLLDNALRHTPAGGSVRIAVTVEGPEAVVEVADECGGIPAPDLDRVFDVAFRGDAARRRADGGGGLGLAIAKGLVEAQDGTIAVTNRSHGCCFSVRFPLAGTHAGGTADRAPDAAP